MTVHVLTSWYTGTVQPPMTEGPNPLRAVEEPYKELCAQMVNSAREAIEDLIRVSDNIKPVPMTKYQRRDTMSFVKPVVQLLGWLAEPHSKGSQFVSLSLCCEYMNLPLHVVSDNLIALLRKIPDNGLRAISHYIARLNADRHFQRKHYQLDGR